MKIYGGYFYGNKISDYGIKNGWVDYRTLAQSFNHVLNNDIMGKTWELGDWEMVSGFVDNTEEIEELKEKIERLEEQIENNETEQEEILEDIEEQETEEELEKMENDLNRLQTKAKKMEEKILDLENEIEYLENGWNYPEIYQYYIVDDKGAEILQEAEETVYYNSELGMYLWGVTHYGTSWDYVLTNIKIEEQEG